MCVCVCALRVVNVCFIFKVCSNKKKWQFRLLSVVELKHRLQLKAMTGHLKTTVDCGKSERKLLPVCVNACVPLLLLRE